MDSQKFSDEIMDAASRAIDQTLPKISRQRYLKTYKAFQDWKCARHVEEPTCEILLLSYFGTMSEDKKPTSLWAYYSMLKSIIKIKENIDIGQYFQLTAFLKAKSQGYEPVKAKAFEEDEVFNFLIEAYDEIWLDVKVAFVFGICGALRCSELAKIQVSDIEDHDDLYLGYVKETKTKRNRSFTINAPFNELVKRYIDLRPPNTETNRFFLNYQSGKCTVQVVGKQKFAKMPRRIATYLNLPNVEEYTGHSIRRTSATILANSGANLERLKRHGGWRSSRVAEGYIQESLGYKRRTGNIILGSIVGLPPSSFSNASTSGIIQKSTTSSNTMVSSSDITKPTPSLNSMMPSNGIVRKKKIETVTSSTVGSVHIQRLSAMPLVGSHFFTPIDRHADGHASTSVDFNNKRKIGTVMSKTVESAPIQPQTPMPLIGSHVFKVIDRNVDGHATDADVNKKRKIGTVVSKTMDLVPIPSTSVMPLVDIDDVDFIDRSTNGDTIRRAALENCTIQTVTSMTIDPVPIEPPSENVDFFEEIQAVADGNTSAPAGILQKCKIKNEVSISIDSVLVPPPSKPSAANICIPFNRDPDRNVNTALASEGYVESSDDGIDDSILLDVSLEEAASEGFAQINGDTIDDSALMEIETTTIRKSSVQAFPGLTRHSLSFTNCKITINFK